MSTAPPWAADENGRLPNIDELRAETFAQTRDRMRRHFGDRPRYEIGQLARLERTRVNAAWQSKREKEPRKSNLYGADASALRWALMQIHLSIAIPGVPQTFDMDDEDSLPFF